MFYSQVYDQEGACNLADVILLDFAKAFGTVPHHQLLLKLRNIGITGKLWLWLTMQSAFRGHRLPTRRSRFLERLELTMETEI